MKVLLKLSGESLAPPEGFGIDPKIVMNFAHEVKELLISTPDLQIAIVPGGGNIWRGEKAEAMGMGRVQADYMGMLATIMNGLAIQDALESVNVACRVMSSIEINKVAEPYYRRKAMRHLEKGRIIVLSGGTGSPYFSTDTTSMLRATELGIKKILMGKNGVDGVYDKDPKINPNAKMYESMKFHDILNQKLAVMDLTAATMADENKLEVVVFNINTKGNINKVIKKEKIGTLISH